MANKRLWQGSFTSYGENVFSRSTAGYLKHQSACCFSLDVIDWLKKRKTHKIFQSAVANRTWTHSGSVLGWIKVEKKNKKKHPQSLPRPTRYSIKSIHCGSELCKCLLTSSVPTCVRHIVRWGSGGQFDPLGQQCKSECMCALFREKLSWIIHYYSLKEWIISKAAWRFICELL